MRAGRVFYEEGTVHVEGLDERGVPVVRLKYNPSDIEGEQGFDKVQTGKMLGSLMSVCMR